MTVQEKMMRLADGRKLGYAEYGDPAGRAVFLFHGFRGSRLDGKALDSAARTAHIRLVAPDRPGFGLSDPQPGRTVGDWPHDVLELALHLHIERFSVLGVGAGAPYVIACAAKTPEYILSAGIASGLSPVSRVDVRNALDRDHRILFTAGRRCRWFARRLLLRSIGPLRQSTVSDPSLAPASLPGIPEAFRQGVEPAVQELVLLCHAWGIAGSEVACPVLLWHGRKDTETPPIMATALADQFPCSITRWYRDEGHSLLTTHAHEVFSQLIS